MNNPTEKTDGGDSLGRKILGGFGNAAIFTALLGLGFAAGAHRYPDTNFNRWLKGNSSQQETPSSEMQGETDVGVMDPATISTLPEVLESDKKATLARMTLGDGM